VLYDRLSDRWILSQFAHSEGAPYLQCIAVSTTDDPLGTYSRYAFKFNYFNDYGKLAVWPDGYYATFNMFSGTARDAPPRGSEACVFDRVSMLNGRNARMVCFAVKETGLLAADMDGNRLPPASSPEYFLGLGTNRLNYWKFHVDWSNTKNSTMSLPLDVSGVPSFVSGCTVDTCDFVPQKDSDSMLDTMGDRLMYRLAYRNFGDHEALVVNHSVRVPGPENQNAGVFAFRWYEIRPFQASLKVQQRGTFRPSGISRWMASMAMDKLGNIAIGYSASGPDEYPSAYYTGRLANETDPNPLGQEKRLWAGSGSQTSDSWGDYTTMTVDPVDDCTLWFVSQYLQKEDANIWHTRISTLRFQGCH
jgi:hypothetical protein